MHKLRKLRIVHWIGLLVVLSMVMVACVPAPAPGAAPASQAPAASNAAASTGGKDLKILYWQAPTILNPHQATGTKDFDAAHVMLEPLAHYNEKDELVPYLAEEIPTVDNGDVAKDGTTTIWKLKKGVKWSDGSDFTADDVVFTWQYCSNKETACVNIANYQPIKTVEAVDANTIKITWNDPNPNPWVSFVGNQGMIIQKKQFEKCVGAAAIKDADCQKANLAPIGTNAYMLKEFKPGDTVSYVKNPQYRDAANVYFDTVEIKGGGDAASAARAVCETGEVDYAWNLQVPKAVLDPILKSDKCDAVAGGSFGVERVVINFSNPDPALGDKRSEPDQPHPFLSDLKVRQAINMAIDRKAIADQLYGAAGVPTCNILVVPSELNSSNTKCDRDVDGAKKLLADAGFTAGSDGILQKDGKPLKLLFQTSINQVRQGAQAIIKANLAEVGISVDLKSVDAGVFFGGDPGNPDTLNKLYADIQMYTNGPDGPDPTGYFGGWTCDKVNSSKNQWQGGNDGRWCNKDYDALFAEYAKTMDPAKRKELAIKLNDTIVNDVALIPLINRVTPSGKSKSLEGPTYNTFDSNLWNINTWKRK